MNDHIPSPPQHIHPTPGATSSHEDDDIRHPKILEVRAYWGHLLLDVTDVSPLKPRFTLGEAGADLFIPEDTLGQAPFPLIQVKEGRYVLSFTPGFQGHVEMAGAEVELAALIQNKEATPEAGGEVFTLPLKEGQRFTLRFGEDIITGAFVHRPKAMPLGFEVDIPFAGVISTLTALTFIAIVLLLRIPPPQELEYTEMPERFAQLLRAQPTPPPVVKAPEVPQPKVEQTEPDPTPPPKPDPAKVSKRDRAIEEVRGSKDELDKRARDRSIAESSGLLGALDESDSMAALFGGGGLGDDMVAAAGALKAGMITSKGPGGRKMGSGPGGSSEGIGGIKTRGGGPGSGDGNGYGDDAGFDGTKKQASLDIGGGGAFVIGQAIDPSLIDKAVREHVSQIRYCYSRELNKNPRLFGKVSVKFVIGGTGRVTSTGIKDSTLGNAAVDNCVADRISRIQFPHPKGGVNVTVIYPFNFNAAG